MNKKPSAYRLYAPQTPYLLLLPSMAVIVLILVIPIVFAVYISFTDSNMFAVADRSWSYVGLDNYRDFITNPSFGRVLYATFVYVVLGVVLTFAAGLAAALLLNVKLRGSAIFKALFILPWVVPQVVLVIIWRWMLNPQFGVINYLLSSVGIVPPEFAWLSNPTIAIFTVMVVTTWKQYPLSFLILLAGLKTIPDELYEAASIDGAGSVGRFMHITWPGLRPVTSVLVLLLTVWAFTNFVIIWLMTRGGPADRTATLAIFSYLNSFGFNRLGYGATIGVIALLFSLAFSIVYYFAFMRRREDN